MIPKYWQTTIQCAHCQKAQLVEQPGHQPVGWVIVAVTETRFDLQKQGAPPQVLYVPYPFCGLECAALFVVMRAWGALRTKEEKEGFKKALLGIKWFVEEFGELPSHGPA